MIDLGNNLYCYYRLILSNRKYVVFFDTYAWGDSEEEDGMRFTGCNLPQTMRTRLWQEMYVVRLHLQYQNKAVAFFVFGVYGQCTVHLRSD